MSNILSTKNGTVDLDTKAGAYKYVFWFLLEHGAAGNVLSAAEKISPHDVRIKSCGINPSPDWGDCDKCGETITIRANYCPGCGGIVGR